MPGFSYRRLRQFLHPYQAIIITAGLFALVHAPERSANDSYFPGGLIWAFVYERAEFVCVRDIAPAAECSGSRRGPRMDSTKHDGRATAPSISQFLNSVGWRVSWVSFIRLVGVIRGKISAAEERTIRKGTRLYRLTLGTMPLPSGFYEVPFGAHQRRSLHIVGHKIRWHQEVRHRLAA